MTDEKALWYVVHTYSGLEQPCLLVCIEHHLSSGQSCRYVVPRRLAACHHTTACIVLLPALRNQLLCLVDVARCACYG